MDDSLKCYDKSIELNPYNYSNYNNKGYIIQLL